MVYHELHEKLGHLGSEKVWDLARQRFYWVKMQQAIEHFIRKQCRCIKSKTKPASDRAPLVPIVATFPFEFVTLDYVHLDRGKGGYEFALVVIDHFTRFAQIYATKKNDGISAADKLLMNSCYTMVFQNVSTVTKETSLRTSYSGDCRS